MKNITNYYIDNQGKLISNEQSYITGHKYRFTVLSPSLIRLEYNENGIFEDRPTSRIINRKFPKTDFSFTESATIIQIATSIFTLTYVKDSPLKSGVLGSNIKAVINGTNIEWQMNNPEVKNMRAIGYSIDSIKDKIILDKGLYSLDGFCLLDDSDSLVLNDDDNFISRESPERDLYLFLYGKDFEACLQDYFTLTGYPSLIPRHALGAWWYKNDAYTTTDIIALVNKFASSKIPLSIFLLGDYWHNTQNNYTPDNTLINLKEVSTYLSSHNIKLGLTINPKLLIQKGSSDYNLISNYFTGDKLSFIPLTNEKLALYLNIYINNLLSQGVNIFSIDYNNPKDPMTLWKFNHYHCGLEEIRNRRGLVLSRNSGIASHRYPVLFSGRTIVNWTTLNLLPRYNLQAYNMGLSFIAHPIGGYHGGIEEDELYLRYLQFACFSPIFLLASDKGKYYKREPWKWNPIIEEHITYYMNLRYKLIPYLYSESYQYHQTGHGLVKPFYHDYPRIIDEPQYQNQYFFGCNFFVAPITTRKNPVINRVMKKVFVPNGIWFDFLQGKKYTGGKSYDNFYRDKDYPIFVKAGSIIPTTTDFMNNIPNSLELIIYPLADGTYHLYEDDGESQNYKKGLYMITNYSYHYEEDNYTITIKKEDGRNLLRGRNYILRFKNTKNIVEVIISDKSIKYNGYYDKDDFVLELYNTIIGRDIEVNIKGKDILVSSETLVSEEIKQILSDLQIETTLKEKLDEILFSNLEIRKKRIKIRKLKKKGLDNKYIKIFISLLEYVEKS